MRIPFSWRLKRGRKNPIERTATFCSTLFGRASEFRTRSEALFCAAQVPTFPVVGDPAITAGSYGGCPVNAAVIIGKVEYWWEPFRFAGLIGI